MDTASAVKPRGKHHDGTPGPRPRRMRREQRGRRDSAPREVAVADSLPASPRVGVLDRDSGFMLVLAKRLERAEWEHTVLSSRISLKSLCELEVDALVVDLDLLGERRWTWLERFCERRPDVRVIVCTAASTPVERVRALRMGVDDWLSKPCHPEELLARVEAVTLHRSRPAARSLEPVRFGEVEVRPDQFQAFVDGRSLKLTRKEYQLIELLSRSSGEVLTRERIYESLWGYEMVRNDRSVDVFVHKLRRKLEQASPAWLYIQTSFGVGYQLDPEPADQAAPQELPVPAAEAELLAA